MPPYNGYNGSKLPFLFEANAEVFKENLKGYEAWKKKRQSNCNEERKFVLLEWEIEEMSLFCSLLNHHTLRSRAAHMWFEDDRILVGCLCDRRLPEYEQRIAGKSVPFEKFSIHKANKYAEQGNHLFLPGMVSARRIVGQNLFSPLVKLEL